MVSVPLVDFTQLVNPAMKSPSAVGNLTVALIGKRRALASVAAENGKIVALSSTGWLLETPVRVMALLAAVATTLVLLLLAGALTPSVTVSVKTVVTVEPWATWYCVG